MKIKYIISGPEIINLVQKDDQIANSYLIQFPDVKI
jgi:hypothetical protein